MLFFSWRTNLLIWHLIINQAKHLINNHIPSDWVLYIQVSDGSKSLRPNLDVIREFKDLETREIIMWNEDICWLESSLFSVSVMKQFVDVLLFWLCAHFWCLILLWIKVFSRFPLSLLESMFWPLTNLRFRHGVILRTTVWPLTLTLSSDATFTHYHNAA